MLREVGEVIDGLAAGGGAALQRLGDEVLASRGFPRQIWSRAGAKPRLAREHRNPTTKLVEWGWSFCFVKMGGGTSKIGGFLIWPLSPGYWHRDQI